MQVTWFNGVFDISNHGTLPVFIWISDGTGTVSFYATTDGHGPVDGNASAFELTPGRTMEVGVAVNTSLRR